MAPGEFTRYHGTFIDVAEKRTGCDLIQRSSKKDTKILTSATFLSFKYINSAFSLFSRASQPCNALKSQSYETTSLHVLRDGLIPRRLEKARNDWPLTLRSGLAAGQGQERNLRPWRGGVASNLQGSLFLVHVVRMLCKGGSGYLEPATGTGPRRSWFASRTGA